MSVAIFSALSGAVKKTATAVTPEVGTITPYGLDTATDVGSYTWSHTRASGAGVHVQFAYRSTANPSPNVASVAYGGEAMTIRAQDKEDGSGRISIVAASLNPGTGPTGANNVVITLSTAEARDGAGHAADVLNSGTAQQGVALAIDDAGDTTASVNITPVNAASLLVGGGAAVDAESTLSVGSGWTIEGSTVESANNANGVEAILQSLATGATTAQAVDISIGASRPMRAAAGIEWLPS